MFTPEGKHCDPMWGWLLTEGSPTGGNKFWR